MKTNYRFFQCDRKFSFTFMFYLLFFLTFNISAQTTVFVDDFNRAALSPGGSPETTYVISNTGSGNAAYTENSIQLRLSGATQAAPTGVAGRHAVFGALTDFSSPFKSKLNENSSDSIVWTFNMRYNYNGNLSGFNAGNRGYAVILVADGNDITTANGYAVVNGGESPTVGRYRLIKFTGGLDDNANITVLVNGITLANVRDYMSLKVKYESSTNTWTFYNRSDGTSAWSDPTVNTGYTVCGTSLDATYTNITMSNFGFTQCYPASTVSFVALFDNFKVVASPNTSTLNPNVINNSKISVCNIKNGFSITANDGYLKVFNSTGKLILNKQIDGSEDIYPSSKGIYLIQIKSKEGINTIKHLFN